MIVRIAQGAAAGAALIAGLAAAQSTSAPTALPPQNYGNQPGFFRSAPEMAAMTSANPGVMPTPAMQPVSQPAQVNPLAAAVVAPQASTVVVAPPERVADPTQNLQWAERQMDRVETKAVQQTQQAATTLPPVAPGAWNGSTNPADR